MSGVRIVGMVLADLVDLLELIPAEQIRAGALPVGSPARSIVVKKISGTDYQTLAKEPSQRVQHRVQVSVRADDYDTKDQAIALVKRGLSNVTGTFGYFWDVSILSAGEGPDFDDEAGSIYQGSHDFMVSFNTLA